MKYQFRYRKVIRVLIVLFAIVTTILCVYGAHDAMVETNEIEYQVILLVTAPLIFIFIAVAYIYFRIEVTDESIESRGILLKKRVLFTEETALVKISDGSYMVSDGEHIIQIVRDIENREKLLEAITRRIDSFHKTIDHDIIE